MDGASSLIDRNKIRLVNEINEIDKNLLASKEGVASSLVLPKIVSYPNSVHEITDVANRIAFLKEKKVPLNEIAVIYAKHKQAQPLIEILESKNITYHTRRRINILQEPLIQNVLTILKYVQSEYERPYNGERFLFEMLYIDFFGLSMRDVAKLGERVSRLSLKRENPFWRDFLKDKN